MRYIKQINHKETTRLEDSAVMDSGGGVVLVTPAVWQRDLSQRQDGASGSGNGCTDRMKPGLPNGHFM